MLSIDKLLDLAEHPVGEFVLDRVDDTVVFTILGNAIAKLGFSEKDICKILNALEQAKPEGGYVMKLKDPVFRENLRDFIAIITGKKNTKKVLEVDTINMIDPTKL